MRRRWRFSQTLFLGWMVFLAGASATHAITSPETLPTGVRALGFVNVDAGDVTSTLNSNGYSESLVQPLNRSVTFQDFASREPRLQKLASVLNSMGDPGVADSLLFANLYSSLQIQEHRTVGALFWGVSDRVSLGIIVPKITRNVNVDFRSEVINGAPELSSRFGHIPQVHEGLQELQTTRIDTSTFESAVFTSKGYLPPRSFNVSSLGDIETEIRIKTFASRRLDLGFRGTVRAPTTTHKPDLRNIFDRELGDGAWGFRAASLHAVKVVPDVLTFQSSIAGTVHLASQTTVALPRNPDDDLADLNDPNQIESVRKVIGSQADLDTGLELNLWKSVLNLSASYQLAAKQRDQVSGSRGLDYERLMRGTDSIVHSTEWSIEFSTIPLFMKGRVPVPAKVLFTYHQPFAGKNAVLAEYGRLDALLFF